MQEMAQKERLMINQTYTVTIHFIREIATDRIKTANMIELYYRLVYQNELSVVYVAETQYWILKLRVPI